MENILILYSSTDGHTIKICQELQSVIEEQGHNVKIISIDEGSFLDLVQFDKVVIGASIRYGNHNKKVFDFVRSNKEILKKRPSAFFSVNIVARKINKNKPENNPYLLKFLEKVDWKPSLVGVFAGKIDYPKYRPFDRLVIRLIMYITNGPTDPNAVVEFTNWERVREFGRAIVEMNLSHRLCKNNCGHL